MFLTLECVGGVKAESVWLKASESEPLTTEGSSVGTKLRASKLCPVKMARTV